VATFTVAGRVVLNTLSIFAVTDILNLYLGIAASFITALVRYIMGIVILALGTSRVDKPLLPNWILSLMWLDSSNGVYYSSVVMHNNHNHPIYLTMVARLCNNYKENE